MMSYQTLVAKLYRFAGFWQRPAGLSERMS